MIENFCVSESTMSHSPFSFTRIGTLNIVAELVQNAKIRTLDSTGHDKMVAKLYSVGGVELDCWRHSETD